MVAEAEIRVPAKPDSKKILNVLSNEIEKKKHCISELRDWAKEIEAKGTDSTETYNIIQRHEDHIEVMQYYFSLELRSRENIEKVYSKIIKANLTKEDSK
jgi:hypothetical protein